LVYSRNANGQVDFRLKQNKNITVSFMLTPSIKKDNEPFDILLMNRKPEWAFEVPDGIPRELASYIPKAVSSQSLMLDLGCGDTRHRPVFEHAGYEYVGVDYESDEATYRGDAHALPFKDESFDFMFSRAAIEHLQYPFVAMTEAYRLLKPHAKFLGSAAFLEPFHGNSYYHATHLGYRNLFENAGFHVHCISPHPTWDVLRAQATMSLFPKMPTILAGALVVPTRVSHRIWWKLGKLFNPEAEELTRKLWTAGSFLFIVEKP